MPGMAAPLESQPCHSAGWRASPARVGSPADRGVSALPPCQSFWPIGGESTRTHDGKSPDLEGDRIRGEPLARLRHEAGLMTAETARHLGTWDSAAIREWGRGKPTGPARPMSADREGRLEPTSEDEVRLVAALGIHV
jgi:hypothetical protein